MKDRDKAKSEFKQNPNVNNWNSFNEMGNRVNHIMSKKVYYKR